jgi:hypothetical protein
MSAVTDAIEHNMVLMQASIDSLEAALLEPAIIGSDVEAILRQQLRDLIFQIGREQVYLTENL